MKERKKSRGAWATAGFGVAVCVVFVLIQVALVVVFGIVHSINHPGADMDAYANTLTANGLFLAVATCVCAPVCISLIIFFAG